MERVKIDLALNEIEDCIQNIIDSDEYSDEEKVIIQDRFYHFMQEPNEYDITLQEALNFLEMVKRYRGGK